MGQTDITESRATERSPLLLPIGGKVSNNDVEKNEFSTTDAEKESETFAWLFVTISVMGLQISAATMARVLLTSMDVAFLGHLGQQELAASSMAQTYAGVPLTFVWGHTASLITLCGQAYGAGNYKLVATWLQFGLLFATFAAFPVFLCFWYNEYLLDLTLEDKTVVNLGSLFSRVISISIWPQLWYACLRQYFQSMGYVYPTTFTGVSAILVSAVFNYILIFGSGSFHGLGFVGSPLATDIAAFYQPTVLLLVCCVFLKLHKKTWTGWDSSVLTFDRLKSFLRVAVPVAAADTIPSIALSLIGAISGRMGSDVVAANSVISSLWGLMWAVFWGFGCATQVKVANLLGAGEGQKARMAFGVGICCTAAIVAVILAFTSIFNYEFFGIITNDNVIIKDCMAMWPFIAAGFVVESFELLMMASFQGMGRVGLTFWVNTLATWGVQLPLAWGLGIYFDYGLSGLWIANLMNEIVKFSFFAFYMLRTDWDERARVAQELAEVESAEQATMLSEHVPSSPVEIAVRQATVKSSLASQAFSPATPCTPQSASLLRVRDALNMRNRLYLNEDEGMETDRSSLTGLPGKRPHRSLSNL